MSTKQSAVALVLSSYTHYFKEFSIYTLPINYTHDRRSTVFEINFSTPTRTYLDLYTLLKSRKVGTQRRLTGWRTGRLKTRTDFWKTLDEAKFLYTDFRLMGPLTRTFPDKTIIHVSKIHHDHYFDPEPDYTDDEMDMDEDIFLDLYLEIVKHMFSKDFNLFYHLLLYQHVPYVAESDSTVIPRIPTIYLEP